MWLIISRFWRSEPPTIESCQVPPPPHPAMTSGRRKTRGVMRTRFRECVSILGTSPSASYNGTRTHGVPQNTIVNSSPSDSIILPRIARCLTQLACSRPSQVYYVSSSPISYYLRTTSILSSTQPPPLGRCFSDASKRGRSEALRFIDNSVEGDDRAR